MCGNMVYGQTVWELGVRANSGYTFSSLNHYGLTYGQVPNVFPECIEWNMVSTCRERPLQWSSLCGQNVSSEGLV